jgi:protein arginine N-methyltransferase 1
VDIIISEWMGYFLLFESMLDTVLYARDKYLTHNGLLLPDYVSLSVVGIQDKGSKAKKSKFWNNVYGFTMRSIQNVIQAEPIIDIVDKELVITTACKFFEIDLYKVQLKDLDFVRKYEVKSIANNTVDGLVCWFDAVFSHLENPITLSTSVDSIETHWCQTLFYLNNPIEVKKNEVVNGMIVVKKAAKNFRNLDLVITYEHKNTKYKQLYKIT